MLSQDMPKLCNKYSPFVFLKNLEKVKITGECFVNLKIIDDAFALVIFQFLWFLKFHLWPWCNIDVYWYVSQFSPRQNSPFWMFYVHKKTDKETSSRPLTLPEADCLPVRDRTKLVFYELFLLGLSTDRRNGVLFYFQQEDRYGKSEVIVLAAVLLWPLVRY